MFKILLLLCICCQAAMSQQNQAQDIPREIKEALQFSRVVDAELTDFIYEAVPAAAQVEAFNILNEAKAGVARCESALQTVEQIWQYKKCSSEQLRKATLALTKLAADTHAHAFNGAASLSCLSAAWLSLIVLKKLH